MEITVGAWFIISIVPCIVDDPAKSTTTSPLVNTKHTKEQKKKHGCQECFWKFDFCLCCWVTPAAVTIAKKRCACTSATVTTKPHTNSCHGMAWLCIAAGPARVHTCTAVKPCTGHTSKEPFFVSHLLKTQLTTDGGDVSMEFAVKEVNRVRRENQGQPAQKCAKVPLHTYAGRFRDAPIFESPQPAGKPFPSKAKPSA